MTRLCEGLVEGETAVKVIADSVWGGSRITTLECCYPHVVHNQVTTHTMLTKSARSARAIPTKHFLKTGVYIPKIFFKDSPGMVERDHLPDQSAARNRRVELINSLFRIACQNFELGESRQQQNRLLEFCSYTTVAITATTNGWNHFFKYRLHKEVGRSGPQDEIQELAQKIESALGASSPDATSVHTPYVPADLREQLGTEAALRLSTARCARVSYTHQNRLEVEKDLELYKKLYSANPPHAGAFEHAAEATGFGGLYQIGRYLGWKSFRHQLWGA